MVKGELAVRHVEVALASPLPPNLYSDLKSRLESWLKSRKEKLTLGTDGEIDLSLLPTERRIPQFEQILKIRVIDDNDDTGRFSATPFLLPGSPFVVHAFTLSREEISIEEIEPAGGGDEWTAACDSLTLPHASLDGLWENLIFDSGIKLQLLEYAQSAILFSDRKVSQHIVHWNRILLLHG
jgi:hypothetical protein